MRLPLGDFDPQAFETARMQRLGLLPPSVSPPASATPAIEMAQDTAVYEQCRTGEVELCPHEWAANRLTPQEREAFERDGYCLIEDALPPALFEAVRSLLIRMREGMVANGVCGPDEQAKAAAFSQANVEMQSERCLRELLTAGRVLPKVVDIMGTNISMYHLHLNVTPPATEPAKNPAVDVDYDALPMLGFHQDSGLQADLEHRPAPRFSVSTSLSCISHVLLCHCYRRHYCY